MTAQAAQIYQPPVVVMALTLQTACISVFVLLRLCPTSKRTSNKAPLEDATSAPAAMQRAQWTPFSPDDFGIASGRPEYTRGADQHVHGSHAA